MESESSSSPVEIFAGTIIEAGLVRSILEGNQIRAYLKDELMGTLQPWFVAPGGAGSVKVMVAGRDAKRAAKLVAEYHANQNE